MYFHTKYLVLSLLCCDWHISSRNEISRWGQLKWTKVQATYTIPVLAFNVEKKSTNLKKCSHQRTHKVRVCENKLVKLLNRLLLNLNKLTKCVFLSEIGRRSTERNPFYQRAVCVTWRRLTFHYVKTAADICIFTTNAVVAWLLHGHHVSNLDRQGEKLRRDAHNIMQSTVHHHCKLQLL